MLKWSFVPICLVVVIISILFFYYQNRNSIVINNKKYIDRENNLILNINTINKRTSIMDIAGSSLDLTIDELIEEEKFISEFKVVSSLNESRLMKRYDINNEFIGYDLIYYNVDDNNQIDKEIEIFLSKTLKYKPSCYQLIDVNELENSQINNTLVKILKSENYYYVLFTYNDYNFEIETLNIEENELLILLLSTLK